MQGDERARLGDSRGATDRAKGFMAKSAAVVVGGLLLAGAFVISLAFFVVALAVVLLIGGYVWWKTRDLRRQVREHLRQQDSSRVARENPSSATVIDGVVISKSETRD